MIQEDTRRRLRTLGQGMIVSAFIGIAYVGLLGFGIGNYWRGAATGLTVCGFVLSFELFVMEKRVGSRLARLPFVPFVLIKSVSYTVLIMAALGLVGLFFGHLRHSALSIDAFLAAATAPGDLLFSLTVATGFSVVLSLNELLGRGVLVNFLTGRYHSPREEMRIFLLIDLVGSTSAAEKLGNIRYHQYLNRFFQVLGPAILNNGGRIHAYVGDQMIVHWPERAGLGDARCLRAVRDACAVVETASPSFEREFGLAPSFRAVLHRGPIVAGEMGGAKREIVFLGDTLNTAARMEAHAKQVGERIVLSGPLHEALGTPDFATIRPLGEAELRGVSRPVSLVAVDF